jgi:pimeloyl-ACP methyl ester carboxylesterase
MLESYRGPVLILNGERDKVNREREDDAARRWNAELMVIPDSGHSCVLSQPDAFSAAARAFLHTRAAPS